MTGTPYASVGESLLPDLAAIPSIPFQAKGKSSFNELHSSLDGHIRADGYQKMHVIRHNDKVIDVEQTSRNAASQYIDEEPGIAIRLKQGTPLAVFVVTKNMRSEQSTEPGRALRDGMAILQRLKPSY